MIFKNQKGRNWQPLASAALLGSHFVACLIVGGVIGYYLDSWFGTKPWLLLTFFLFGVAAGFKTMYQEAMKIQRHDQRSKETEPED